MARCTCSSFCKHDDTKNGCTRTTRSDWRRGSINNARSSCNSSRYSSAATKKPRPALSSLHDQLIKTNLDMVLLGIFVAYWNTAFASQLFDDSDSNVNIEEEQLSAANVDTKDEDEYEDIYDDENDSGSISPVYAILFPFFTQTIAIFIYYLITRYLKILPYTAIVFLLGTTIGYATNTSDSDAQDDAVSYSTSIWLGINGQVILLVFLPGLIFHDSFTINVHLFFQAFWQLIVFAFPMVLGGTALTALVAGFVLPYNWSPSLCMTFGAILSGTDPIAVAGLLNASGAPNRLKMHISGESLLNDGSVVVLYNIFSALFFNELGIDGFGQQFSVAEGFAYFFRLSLGGCCIGLAFGLATVFLLKMLNRRLSEEENVVQVVLTVSSAYLCYFTSEILCTCSGIMATIACGISVKVLGETFINDYNLTLHFWQVTAELLNTLLFVLGGCLWGKALLSTRAEDWGYLALLFVFLLLIRFILVFGLYPITTRIGIGTNWRESVFMGYGGFRGSVGIALALSLEAQIYNNTEDESYRKSIDKLFSMVGGISVLTLLINGMTAGPLLTALGLGATETTRQKVIENYKQQMIQNSLQAYVRLLSQQRWKGIDHSIIKHHVPYLDGFTFDELMVAVERHKNNTPIHLYVKPSLEHVFPYIKGEQITGDCSLSNIRSQSFERLFKSKSYERLLILEQRASPGNPRNNGGRDNSMRNHVFDHPDHHAETDENPALRDDIDEVRLNYIEILRSSYYHQIENGSLEERGDLTYSLFQGLDFCEDTCGKGQQLNDWEATKVASDTRVVLANRIFLQLLRKIKHLRHGRKFELDKSSSLKVRFLIRQNLAFVRAHRHAQKIFGSQFAADPMTPAEAQVIEESNAQIQLAEADLNDIDQVDVMAVKGHLLCLVLLNNSVKYVEQLSRQHLIPEQAASEILQVLDDQVENVWVCSKLVHDGRLSTSTQLTRLRQLPPDIIQEFDIWKAIAEISQNSFIPPSTSPLRQSIFRQRCDGGSGENLQVKMAPNNTISISQNDADGGDAPLISTVKRPESQGSQLSQRVVLQEDEFPVLPRSDTNESDTPLTF